MAALFADLMPELWRQVRGVTADLANLAEVYAESIDYGIMESSTGTCRSPAMPAGATSAPGTRWRAGQHGVANP